MARSLENKVALVVGGSSGIGRATALALAEAGAKVVIAARREVEGSAVAREIGERGGEALFVRADATVASDVQALVAKAADRWGRLDCALNNVGITGDYKTIADFDEPFFDQIMATNVKSAWLCMKYEVKQMLTQGGGVIVNTASYLGHTGHPYAALYAASKHAVISMTKSAAVAYAKHGIRVNAVSPTLVGDTPMVEYATKTFPQGVEAAIAEIPLGRAGKSSEVANAVTWLCSDLASFVTGHSLVLDGGQLAG